MNLEDRLDGLPNTGRLDSAKSFEAVILDVIEWSDMHYVVLDQTCLDDGDSGILITDVTSHEITCAREKHGVTLHITHEAPRKGEFARVERR